MFWVAEPRVPRLGWGWRLGWVEGSLGPEGSSEFSVRHRCVLLCCFPCASLWFACLGQTVGSSRIADHAKAKKNEALKREWEERGEEATDKWGEGRKQA